MTRARDLADLIAEGVVGTVSESGGVPTGAIVQTATTADGTYVRFADGTQICWGGITSSSGGAVTWTFPIAFVATPRIQATCLATGNGRIAVYSNASGTSADFSVYSTANALVDAIFTSVMAVGRWY